MISGQFVSKNPTKGNGLLLTAMLLAFGSYGSLAQPQTPPAKSAEHAEVKKKAGGVEIVPLGKPQPLRDAQGRLLDWSVQPKEFVQFSAEGGDTHAMLELAFRPSDEDRFKWLLKAANHGSVAGMLFTSASYRVGTGTTPDKEQADYWLDRANANLQRVWSDNDGVEMFFVAMNYLTGPVPADQIGKITVSIGANTDVLRNTDPDVSLPFDPREGIKWLRRSSEAGYYRARLVEYQFSTQGLVVKREGQAPETIVERKSDEATTQEWLKRVEDGGDPLFAMAFASCCVKPSPERLKLLRIAGEAGLEVAVIAVADSYATGADGIKDADVATTWLQRGVSAGSFQATIRLAEEYCKGTFVPKNQAAAESYYKEVSGSLLAHFEEEKTSFYADMALRYASGVCVQQNELAATSLFAKISKRHAVPIYAAVLLGLSSVSNQEMSPYLGKNPKYGLRLLEEVSNDAAPLGPGLEKSNIGSAQLLLADAYSAGTGVQRDYSKAVSYLQMAAKNDVPAAMYRLGESYEQGMGVPKDNTQALKWYGEAGKNGIPAAEAKRADLEKKINQEQEIAKQQALAKQQEIARQQELKKAATVSASQQSGSAATSKTSSSNSNTQLASTNTGVSVSPTQPPSKKPAPPPSKNSPSFPSNLAKDVHWSLTPIPDSMTVAFSFSKRCLQDSCGDGAWGADIEKDSQAAIDGSANSCESNTSRKGSCGVGNGGRYFVQCRPGDPPKWVALAIYDDGSENLVDGEAIAYPTQTAAEQAAVSNCGQQGCHAVWSRVICKNDSESNAGNCGDSRNGNQQDWANVWIGLGNEMLAGRDERRVDFPDSGVRFHIHYWLNGGYSNGSEDETILFASLGEITLYQSPSSTQPWAVILTPKSGGNFISTGGRAHQFNLDFKSKETAEQARDFFEYHRCAGR